MKIFRKFQKVEIESKCIYNRGKNKLLVKK